MMILAFSTLISIDKTHKKHYDASLWMNKIAKIMFKGYCIYTQTRTALGLIHLANQYAGLFYPDNICKFWSAVQLESNDSEWVKVKVFVSHVNNTKGHSLQRELSVIQWTRHILWMSAGLFPQPPQCLFKVPMLQNGHGGRDESNAQALKHAQADMTTAIVVCFAFAQQRLTLSP